jgi:hypothetical protein
MWRPPAAGPGDRANPNATAANFATRRSALRKVWLLPILSLGGDALMTRCASRLARLAIAGLFCVAASHCSPQAGPSGGSGAGGAGPGGAGGAASRGGSGGRSSGGTGGSSGGAGGGTGGAAGSGGAGGSGRPEPEPDASTDPEAGPPPDATGPAGADPFGVRKVYPTKAGGREWYLPAEADRGDGEWSPPGTSVTRSNEPGVFHIEGSPRIAVASPPDKPWWRNVELTGYYRLRRTLTGDIAPEIQHYARGERHVTSMIDGASINGSRPAPPGTPVWPGYPFSGMINGHCLGSSYKGYLYATGRMDFKKEISHTEGYTGARGGQMIAGGMPANAWIGLKVMIRNFDDNQAVHMESWIDERADGNWRKVTEVRDTGGWTGGAGLDGCGAAPFNYKQDQLVTWAGPYVNFRFDNLSTDFKWMSAREIDPLP